MDQTYSLDSSGHLFKNNADKVSEIHPIQADVLGLGTIMSDPYQHFFKNPFNSISYLVNDHITETVVAHPSSFYPGSPFDVFESIRKYETEKKLLIPRFYLYPTSACNSHCIICQFAFRHKKPYFIPFNSIKTYVDYLDSQLPRPRALSTIISGDGEPTLYPHFEEMIQFLNEKDIRMFLSSNFLMSGTNRTRKIATIGDNVDMLTISIKGLSSGSYRKYQGKRDNDYGLEQVMFNLEDFLNRIIKQNRRSTILVGVASLILPENTGYYVPMVKRFIELGLDYVYLNEVEPSYKRWNIDFSSSQRQQTDEELMELEQLDSSGTMIRFPTDYMKGTTGESVYYDANQRICPDICGSALWNPLLMAIENQASLIACRSNDKFTNSSFFFNQKTDLEQVGEFMSPESINRVMSVTDSCNSCRLERQVRLYDELIAIERKYSYGGKFVLNFPASIVNQKIGVINFEKTFNRR